MKKSVLYMALVSVSFSLSTQGMGLGDITVRSSLNQPFNADIELVDVGDTPLSGIKANLASVEDFERVGLEQVYALTALTFNIEKNKNGKPIIRIRSSERMSEPFLPLLVDLAWTNGQVYRSYTVLLDPPNYQPDLAKKQIQHKLNRQAKLLSSAQHSVNDQSVNTDVDQESDRIPLDQRRVVNYGPTGVNETVWQIAQRHKSGRVLLQQMILAVVGTNPDAFTEGNLNGLKEGSRLKLPTYSTAIKVPDELAKLEVLAHDKAWQTRHPIEHALLPPYIDAKAPIELNEKDMISSGHLSILPAVPVFSSSSVEDDDNLSRIISLNATPLFTKKEGTSSTSGEMLQEDNTKAGGRQALFKAELNIVAAAIDSFRQSNVLLGQQLHTVQIDNTHLKQQLALREQELKHMKLKLHQLLIRQKTVFVPQQQANPIKKVIGWEFILLLVGLGGGLTYWHFGPRFKLNKTSNPSTTGGADEQGLVFESILDAPVTEPVPVVREEPPKSKIILPEEEHGENPVTPKLETQGLEACEEKDHMNKPMEFTTEVSPSYKEGLQMDQDQITPLISDAQPPQQVVDASSELSNEHVLEFEPGFHEAPVTAASNASKPLGIIKPKRAPKPIKTKGNLDMALHPIEPSPTEASAKPAKSKIALDTLLALAKTYVSMDDLEAARQSLQEVLDHGNEGQRLEATNMLNELEKK